NNHSGLPATIVQINGDDNRAYILQQGDFSKKAEIRQTGYANKAVVLQRRDLGSGSSFIGHSVTIKQGNTGFSDFSAGNNAVVVQEGGYAMHKATVNQGTGEHGQSPVSILNTALVAQTQTGINDTATVNQSGGEHRAISIQGIQPGHSDAWKDSQPMTPVPPAFGFQMFTN
ncbi:MAG: hypothetical protein ACE5E9_14915, partial [Nitrospinaceae bacterium]